MRTARRFWYRRAVYVRMGVNEKNPSPGQTKQPNEHLKIRESGKATTERRSLKARPFKNGICLKQT